VTHNTLQVANLGKRGEKNLLVVPIAFTSDHIETLFEIDHEISHVRCAIGLFLLTTAALTRDEQVAQEFGVTNFVRSESLNDDPQFARALADIVAQHLKTEEVRFVFSFVFIEGRRLF